MKTKLQLILLLGINSLCAFSQSDKFWSGISKTEINEAANLKAKTFPTNSKYYKLNLESLKTVLLTAPEVISNTGNVIITIPGMSGKPEQFRIWEDSNFAPELQAQYPDIHAYSGRGIDDPAALLKISIAPNGIQTMVLRGGKKPEFMEPCTTAGSTYALFNSIPENGRFPFNCTTNAEGVSGETDPTNRNSQSNTQTLKKFRLALSCTAEYTAYHGGTVAGALAAMNATMTRVNGVFENDFAVKLEIIANNTNVIFTNAATDPYDETTIGSAGAPAVPTWNGQLQATLTAVIGEGNYDIGHLLGTGWGNGNAGCIGCVCSNGKGSAFSTPTNAPEGDLFDISTVAHEMGHQLGATHVFSHEFQAGGTLIEPGSGSTIMSYAGVTSYDIQSTSDAYFNSRNILQVQSNLATKFCATDILLANAAPAVSAGNDFVIPKGTPFVLTGIATATNSGALTYTWEENDPITSAAFAGSNSFAFLTKAAGPDFRSIAPGLSPTRYFPALSSVLSNILSTSVESVSNVGRSFKFVFTARDNVAGGGQTSSDNNVIIVNANAGPFDVTSQNTDDISWAQGSIQTITWAVNNTDLLSGSANVDILLSTDGGLTYPVVLLSGTPNDGSQAITVPNITAIYCRVMVRPSGNIYYNINIKPFSIGYTTVCTTYSSNAPLVVPDGIENDDTSGDVASSTFTVPLSGIVTDVSVTLNVTHSWSQDLVIALQRPDNTMAFPWNKRCFIGNNWNFTFSDGAPEFDCLNNFGTTTGTIAPSFPLSALNNAEASGTWILTAADFKAGNTGQINSWSVEVCEKILMALAIKDYQLDGIILYPNPSKTVMTISTPDGILPDSFLIYSSIGQAIANTIVKSASDLTVDTTPLSSGVYLIRINKDNASKTLRFIKN